MNDEQDVLKATAGLAVAAITRYTKASSTAIIMILITSSFMLFDCENEAMAGDGRESVFVSKRRVVIGKW